MGAIGVILLVAFVIISILLVCLVLIQNEDGEGMGGLFGGSNSQAFGARSGNVLTKTTYICNIILPCYIRSCTGK